MFLRTVRCQQFRSVFKPQFNRFISMTKRKIGTHDGTFHCDEALACFMLKQTAEFRDSEVTRSRDPKVLDEQDIVVDVGGVYDATKLRFDHHQIGFDHTLDGYKTKLSSAGLVYKHYGREIIKNLTGKDDEKTINIIFDKVYKYFVEEIDGVDNGVNQYETENPAKYRVTTTLGARVASLNPDWNDASPNPNASFVKAMNLTGEEFTEKVNYFANSWFPAREIVESAFDKREQVDPSGEIIVLEKHCPWKSHLYDLEKEKNLEGVIKFALFGDQNGSWRVQAISKTESSFSNRVDLLWKGMRDKELSEASGIENGVFVHISGFIGGNKTKEGALEMARKSLAASKQ
ncbi:UPF0160 protein MYG1, mitochondrial-like [Planoprotostelium fungivorum]|uniref:UPF0160 protein MYG1, mitochondrial-like n=1 Tax=Planoprotostelium fungivorum TaxID=1890364 RepID=A0A2P6NX86_9EUKA|nr:UPF0160 protein MYG1, mitochondrial-like [Planoprotostelium fungivorum]